MCEYIRSFLAGIGKNSKVFVLMPNYFTTIFFKRSYELLFAFLTNTICFPIIVYHDWFGASSIIHKIFHHYPNNIMMSKDTLVYHIKQTDPTVGFFCWEYRHIAKYLWDTFNIEIPDLEQGGCYILHLPENGEPELKVIHQLDWPGVNDVLSELLKESVKKL